MIEIVSHSAVADWVAKRLSPDSGVRAGSDFGSCYTIGIMVNGVPSAGVVYNWYRVMPHGGDMRITVAVNDRFSFSRATLRAIFSYPFHVARCARVTAIVSEKNKKSSRLAVRVGFRKEGVLRRGWDGKTNAIIYSMLRNECRWC